MDDNIYAACFAAGHPYKFAEVSVQIQMQMHSMIKLMAFILFNKYYHLSILLRRD